MITDYDRRLLITESAKYKENNRINKKKGINKIIEIVKTEQVKDVSGCSYRAISSEDDQMFAPLKFHCKNTKTATQMSTHKNATSKEKQ